MKGGTERNRARAPGRQPRKLERTVDRLGAAVGKKDMIEMRRQHFDQLGGEAGAHIVVEKARAGDQRLRLLCNGFAQRRVTVAEQRDALRRAEVKIAPPCRVVEPAAFAAYDHGIVASCRGSAEDRFFESGEFSDYVHLVPPGRDSTNTALCPGAPQPPAAESLLSRQP